VTRRIGTARLLSAGAVALALLAVVLVWTLRGSQAAGSSTPLLAAKDPLAAASIATRPGPADAVLTQRGDLTRLGWSSTETRLTVASVGGRRFGRRASLPVDGRVYAQPLYVPGLQIGGESRNVVIVATEHDTVYAFDVDAARPLWRVSLLTPGSRMFQAASDRVADDRRCDSIAPEVGITGTPVIDWSTKRLYVMALDIERHSSGEPPSSILPAGSDSPARPGVMTYRVHVIDLVTGRSQGTSAAVAGDVAGSGLDAASGRVAFRATEQQQRMGLALVDGTIYAGFSSWCGWAPYHGWVFGYRAADLSRDVVYNDSPGSYGGGLWESESGISADGHGHLFLVTGNGAFNVNTGGSDAGDTIMEMVPHAGTLRAIDTFTPFDQQCRAQHDQDLGSGSPLMVPGHNEIILSSKTGSVYVLDQSRLGGYHSVPQACRYRARTDVDHIRQELTIGTVPGGMWGTWAYWRAPGAEYVYGSGTTGRLTQWQLSNSGTLVPRPVSQAPESLTYPGAIPVTSGAGAGSAAGTGIVWAIDQTHGAVLRAYDAADLGHEIWNSAMDRARDGLHGFDHFDIPTIAGGHVLVGDQNRLEIYGVLPA
jgi:hypothetical protein